MPGSNDYSMAPELRSTTATPSVSRTFNTSSYTPRPSYSYFANRPIESIQRSEPIEPAKINTDFTLKPAEKLDVNRKIYRTQNWEDKAKLDRFGTSELSTRQERKFNRYAKSKKGEAARLAFDAAEMDKFNKSVDVVTRDAIARMKSAYPKPTTPTTPTTPRPEVSAYEQEKLAEGYTKVATPGGNYIMQPPADEQKAALDARDKAWAAKLTPRSNAEWTRIAKENGFADMGEVLAWQEANGLEADGKFGNASSAFFKANGLGKYQKTPEGYVELSRPDGTTFLQRTGTFNTSNSTPTPSPSAEKPKKKNSWFANATMAAAMADAPAVMTASGWRQNEAGDYVQDREDDPGVERLRNNLAVLGGTATGITTAGLMTAGAAGTAAIAAPEATPLLTGPAAKHFLYDAAGKLLMAYKQGGTMNRINYFQQGGAAPQQDMQAQVVALVQAAMQGDQKATQTVNQIMEAAKAGDQQAIQIAQLMEQVIQQMQGQATAAKYGAKLNYLQSLKCGGKSMKKKEQGGKVCPACEQAKQTKKPLITKHQSGGAVGFYRNWTPDEIRKLQNKLAAYGYYEGDLDGIVGSQTINAVKKFQTEHGVAADGMWGKNTNSQKQFVDWETADKGGRKSTWKIEQGSLVALPTNFTYTKLSDLSNKDAQAVIDYYSAYPELLYSDDPEHAKWRQVFHNSGQAGADFLNQSFGAMSVADRAEVDPKKTTTSHKTAELQSDMAEGNTRAAAQLLPVLTSPFAIGGVTSVLAGSAGLAGYTGLAGSMIGAPIGGNVGAKRGRKRGEKKQDELYHDEVAERYGVASAVHDPKRRIAEEEAKGRNVGTLVGGLAGGVGGSIAGAGAEAGYYSLLGQGRANLGYAGTPATAQPSVGMYGTTTPPPVQGVSNMQMLKAGLKPANLSAGRTRLGGTYGIRFNHNGKFYNAGTPASQEVINAANTYYNNPMSPLRVNFGGTTNTGAGAKLGLAYGVNVPAAAGIGAQVAPMGIIVDDAISDTQPNHPVRQQRRADRKEERKERRQERHRRLISRTAESTTD